jgi:hypothetical protein
MSLTCDAIIERAKDLAQLSLRLDEIAQNRAVPPPCRYRAAVMSDQAIELGEQFEALLGEIRRR